MCFNRFYILCLGREVSLFSSKLFNMFLHDLREFLDCSSSKKIQDDKKNLFEASHCLFGI